MGEVVAFDPAREIRALACELALATPWTVDDWTDAITTVGLDDALTVVGSLRACGQPVSPPLLEVCAALVRRIEGRG